MSEIKMDEVAKAVRYINECIWGATDGVEYVKLTVESDGDCLVVKLPEIILWTSESDCGERDEGHTIHQHLNRVVEELLDEFKKIRIEAFK
ncbi:MAG: hypothetical protein M0R49_01080 [Limnochordia bacterium]|nr:hypothetical protein [Limnochordia bacterium]